MFVFLFPFHSLLIRFTLISVNIFFCAIFHSSHCLDHISYFYIFNYLYSALFFSFLLWIFQIQFYISSIISSTCLLQSLLFNIVTFEIIASLFYWQVLTNFQSAKKNIMIFLENIKLSES